MTQHAIVKRLSGQDVAEISLLRQVECSMHCDSCGGCLKPPAGEELLALAKNPIGAKPGDRVEVETTTGNSIGMALLVFGFPCLALVLGYLAGGWLRLGEMASIGLGALALVVSFVVLWAVNRSVTRRHPTQFDIVGFAR